MFVSAVDRCLRPSGMASNQAKVFCGGGLCFRQRGRRRKVAELAFCVKSATVDTVGWVF